MTKTINQGDGHVELVAIEGEQLSALTFVQDCVELHFDGPRITAITWPLAVRFVGAIRVGSPYPGLDSPHATV